MSSWDSMDKIGKNLKVRNAINDSYPIEYRVVYDTPHYVEYSLIVFIDGDPVVLRSWSREKSNIDARSMSDCDVYDLFSTSIEKYLNKITTEGVSIHTWRKYMKDSGLL